MTGLGANTLRNWAAELETLDEQIEALQVSKKEFYGSIRDDHGKITADALKAAMKLRRMDGEKRAKADEVDAETARILSVLESPDRAPRATRVEKIEQIPPHGAETGELAEENEPVAAADTTGDYLREPMAAASGQIVREGDAPRETDRLAVGGDASCPDTEFETPAPLPQVTAPERATSSPSAPATSSDFDPERDLPAFMRRTDGYPKSDGAST